MKKIFTATKKRILRKRRTKAKILAGGAARPRFCVSKTNKHIFLQIIDDGKGATLVSVYDKEVKVKKGEGKIELGRELGKAIAGKAKDKKITKVVFDRGRFAYHGIVKAIAEGAREGGLEF